MLSLFEVVAEPSRRKILDLLRKNDRAVNDLAETLGLAQPAVSSTSRCCATRGSSPPRSTRSAGCTACAPSRCASSMRGWRRTAATGRTTRRTHADTGAEGHADQKEEAMTTCKPKDVVTLDMDRDNGMSAATAKEQGLIDEILEPRRKAA